MIRIIVPILMVTLFSCTSKQDKLAAELSKIDTFMGIKPQLDKIPDSMAKKMHDFAVAFPQNPKSEEYLYRATQISEMSGRFFETAKWCEDYIKTFPKGKNIYEATIAAAHNFEKSGTFDKAIEYYTKVFTVFPKSELAEPAKQTVKMLKLGLVTPEQQLEYLIKQNNKDSVLVQ